MTGFKYSRTSLSPDEKLAERFWAKVDRPLGGGCWEWQSPTNDSGYGTMRVDGKTRRATHVALYLATGRWPEAGENACHRCDNPSCVRPDHLFLGTQKDNIRDAMSKGRHVPPPTAIPPHLRARGERKPSAKLTEQQVREIRGSSLPNREVGVMYGINSSTVSRIKNGQKWAHVK